MQLKHSQQAGFTLLEMMISLIISAVVISGSLTLFSSFILHSNKTMDKAKLHEQLSHTMSLISNDIRRAGSWGDARLRQRPQHPAAQVVVGPQGPEAELARAPALGQQARHGRHRHQG